MIIALSGYARSGKNATAEFLVRERGFKQIAFADALRGCVAAMNPIVDLDGRRYNDVVAEYGYDAAKEQFQEVRAVLQRMGTEVGRDIIGPNIWVDLTMQRILSEPDADWVITDCRFPNEAEVVDFQGGFVVRVRRPGYEAVNDHVSEHALANYPFAAYITNDGSLDDLYVEADSVITSLCSETPEV